jgi:hypothetical protein
MVSLKTLLQHSPGRTLRQDNQYFLYLYSISQTQIRHINFILLAIRIYNSMS